jgi:hypothetical protein
MFCRRKVASCLGNLRRALMALSARAAAEKLRVKLLTWQGWVSYRRALARETALKLAGRYVGKPFRMWRTHAQWATHLTNVGKVTAAMHVGRTLAQVRVLLLAIYPPCSLLCFFCAHVQWAPHLANRSKVTAVMHVSRTLAHVQFVLST